MSDNRMLSVKAANAAHASETVKVLSWKNQGQHPEAFPVLGVGSLKAKAVR